MANRTRRTRFEKIRLSCEFFFGLCGALGAGCGGNRAEPDTAGSGGNAWGSGGTLAHSTSGGSKSTGGAFAQGGSVALGGSGVGGLSNTTGDTTFAGSMNTNSTSPTGGHATGGGDATGSTPHVGGSTGTGGTSPVSGGTHSAAGSMNTSAISSTGGALLVGGGTSAFAGGGLGVSGGATGAIAGAGGIASSGGASITGGHTSMDAGVTTGNCDDLIENNLLERWTVGSADDPPATTTFSILTNGQALIGQQAWRAVTTAGFDFWLRYAYVGPIDVTGYDELRFAIRGLNTTPNGWQGNYPEVILQDAGGARRTFTPVTQLLNTDGVTWIPIRVPLAGGNGWQVAGGSIDLSSLAAIEIHADTWDSGFTLDIDALSFERAGAVCPCPLDCGKHGQCGPDSYSCLCDLGYAGADCSACQAGYTAQANGTCALGGDGAASVWPNAFSKSNSDPWLMAHHDEIMEIAPKVLVLNFANPATPSMASNLLDAIFAAFTEASRAQGYRDATALPQLKYQLARLIDLRDGVNGRPAAPAGYPYDNSTLYPATGSRPATYDSKSPPAFGSFDYAALFSGAFAKLYGYPDPSQAGQYLDLCALVEQGTIHEVWVIASGDKPDAAAAEVLETKPLYTTAGNRLSGAERCAGNGCFASNVPFCGRSLRIGFVNYNRGPGCFMESLSHGLESAMNHRVAPALSEWFTRFAGFDLDQRYGLPFSSWYGLNCTTLPDTPCLTYATQTSVRIQRSDLNQTIAPFDAICGNVHYPPNGQKDYDINNSIVVQSSCQDFGNHSGAAGADEVTTVSSDLWMTPYGTLASDCDGPFLVWWWQNMPGYQSGKTFTDGRRMKSVWPFLYY